MIAVGSALAALLLVLGAVHAHVVVRNEAVVAPAAATPPLRLAPGLVGGTQLGASLTTAVTDLDTLLRTAQQTLSATNQGTSTWEVRVRLVAMSNLEMQDDLTIQLLVGGDLTRHVIIVKGAVVQGTGPWTALAAASQAGVELLGAKTSLQSSTVDLRLEMRPQGAVAPTVAYAYRVDLQ